MEVGKIPKLSAAQEEFGALHIDMLYTFMETNHLDDTLYDELLCSFRKSIKDCTERDGSIDEVRFYFAALDAMNTVACRHKNSRCTRNRHNYILADALYDPCDYAETIEHSIDLHILVERIYNSVNSKDRLLLDLLADQYSTDQIAQKTGFTLNQIKRKIRKIRCLALKICTPAEITELL